MDPATMYAVGSIAASAIGGMFSKSNTSSANAAAVEEARLNREFQEDMSNTAMQRRVEDLKKADINPMLAYMNGASGASQPTGSVAPVQVNQGSAQAMAQIAQNLSGMINIDKQRELLQAQADAAIASGKEASARTANLNQANRLFNETMEDQIKGIRIDVENKEWQSKLNSMDYMLRGMDLKQKQELLQYIVADARLETELKQGEVSFNKSPVGRILSMVGQAMGIGDTAASIYKRFKGK